MPFFTILGHLATAGYIGCRLIGEGGQKRQNRTMSKLSQKFQKMYTDPELEAELKAKIENPEYYDLIWERIESYKRNRGKYYLWRNELSFWKSVGHKRLKFFIKGSLRGKSQKDADWLRYNRGIGLWLLIQTYGRMTQRDAYFFMSRSSHEDMLRYLKSHPADVYLNDTHTALDEAPLEGVDMPDGWPEDHRHPNDVPE